MMICWLGPWSCCRSLICWLFRVRDHCCRSPEKPPLHPWCASRRFGNFSKIAYSSGSRVTMLWLLAADNRKPAILMEGGLDWTFYKRSNVKWGRRQNFTDNKFTLIVKIVHRSALFGNCDLIFSQKNFTTDFRGTFKRQKHIRIC
jgi:hypothetical protein